MNTSLFITVVEKIEKRGRDFDLSRTKDEGSLHSASAGLMSVITKAVVRPRSFSTSTITFRFHLT